jgi:EAL domain-containing protein (putative c-di-GMP-specific phosphodiesterase class I)
VWAARSETSGLKVAVNVSPRQFRQTDFVQQVASTLRRTGANPRRLTLELTEGMLIHSVEEVIDKMRELKAEGVGFALDDFGTGYSSLYLLKRLPFNQIKIDRSFVQNMLTEHNDAAIVNMIIALGRTLGLEVLAEGIETIEQRDFLYSAGCYRFQGYFFSRPRVLASFEQFAVLQDLQLATRSGRLSGSMRLG